MLSRLAPCNITKDKKILEKNTTENFVKIYENLPLLSFAVLDKNRQFAHSVEPALLSHIKM